MESEGKWGMYLLNLKRVRVAAMSTTFDEAIRGDKACTSYLQQLHQHFTAK